MSCTPFAYNPGELLPNTVQYCDLAVGDENVSCGSNYGGLKWWSGPDNTLGYVIASVRVGGQPVPGCVIEPEAYVGFWRSKLLTDESFLELANYIAGKSNQPPFANVNDAVIWLNSNCYYTSYVPIQFNCSTCIGEGWLPYNIDTCYRVSTTGVTTPVTPISLSAKTATVNTDFGTQFYSTFSINGTGTIDTTSTTQNIWRRTQPGGLDGPLNRCALWATDNDPNSDPPYDVWLGFSVCLTGILAEKTYYVGIGADNNYKLTLDGNVILNTVGGPLDDSQDSFKYWHVYPVVIGAGDHILELFGLNNSSIAGFGCEIYDNTLEELTGFTTYSQLNVIFTSSGQTQATIVQNLSNQYLTSGYTCPSGYVYSVCDGTCTKYEYCPEVELPTPTPTQTPTNTKTPTPTPTQTPTQTPSNCTSYTVIDIGNLSPSTFTYQDCTTLNTEEITLSDGSEITICAITGSILLVSGLIDIINNGPCINITPT
jgi:hypothetical protein